MHAAKLEKSKRLQRTLAYLRDGQWHSTRDIVHGADICAVNAAIPELECNGFVIERKHQGHRCYYRLIPVQAEFSLEAA